VEYLDSYRARGDLFLADLQGSVTRVTQGERLDHPDVSPDGSRAVAVQEEAGTSRLVLVDLDSGAVTPLTEYSMSVHWSYPRWSPDGRWIAAARWEQGAYLDVVLLDDGGDVRTRVTRDRAVDIAPSWSPDGHWLLWSSDRTGIPNLMAVEVNPETGEVGSVRQVTNLLGGGAFPAVDPQGSRIYFSSYHADGWYVETIPFRPQDWGDPLPTLPELRMPVDVDHLARRQEGPEESYSPFPTLRPTYWLPSFIEEQNVGEVEVLKPGYGLYTSVEDLVGRHALSFGGTVSGGYGRFSGVVAYTFAGLGNPHLSLSTSQSFDADSRPWAGITQQNDTVPIYRIERERSVTLGTTFFRRRARTDAFLSLAGSHLWEDTRFLEENLEESDRFFLSRPDVRLGELRAAVGLGTARAYAFSVSREEGIGLYVRSRTRADLQLPDSLDGVKGHDRSLQDVIFQGTLYKGLPWMGFGNHVLGIRVSAGTAAGAGADAFHYDLGGASGGAIPIGLSSISQGFFFPLRGYVDGDRSGTKIWSFTAEYRFPLALINQGPGLIPLHLNWISGSLFMDAGNAWGGWWRNRAGQIQDNPRQDALTSVGAEVMIRFLPFWYRNFDIRAGVGVPLVDLSARDAGPRWYVRLGPAF
jgi:hypothetical protein